MAKPDRARLRLATTRLLQADDGVTALEYGLLAAFIAVMVLIGLSAIGSSLNDQLSQLGSATAAAQSGSPGGGSSGSSGNNGKGAGGCGVGQKTAGC